MAPTKAGIVYLTLATTAFVLSVFFQGVTAIVFAPLSKDAIEQGDLQILALAFYILPAYFLFAVAPNFVFIAAGFAAIVVASTVRGLAQYFAAAASALIFIGIVGGVLFPTMLPTAALFAWASMYSDPDWLIIALAILDHLRWLGAVILGIAILIAPPLTRPRPTPGQADGHYPGAPTTEALPEVSWKIPAPPSGTLGS
ncbi:MAG: hypothetical protein Q4G21_09360 [Dermabacter sp.]|nr:hypothetical protein [Dermabacter sp.]